MRIPLHFNLKLASPMVGNLTITYMHTAKLKLVTIKHVVQS